MLASGSLPGHRRMLLSTGGTQHLCVHPGTNTEISWVIKPFTATFLSDLITRHLSFFHVRDCLDSKSVLDIPSLLKSLEITQRAHLV